jgi:cob(I)alamin adenosyltransferase
LAKGVCVTTESDQPKQPKQPKKPGETSLVTGQRVRKDTLRIEINGLLDEFFSTLGLARSLSKDSKVKASLLELQELLMLTMAELSSLNGTTVYISEEHLQLLLDRIKAYEDQLPPWNGFVIPGDDPASATLHVARTIVRNAERVLVTLSAEVEVQPFLLEFLNKLSTYVFALAVYESNLDH